VAGCDFTKDVGIGQPVLQGVQQSLHKLRVTMKWLLGALSDFDPSSKPVASSTNGLLDRIALQQLSQVSHTVHSSFEIYNISKAVTAVNRYINQDLSAFYFETLKDRLYTGSKIERLSAQATLYHIFNELLAMLSSIVPLTVEEVWGFVPAQIQVESEHPLRRVWSPFTTSATQTGPESSEELETMTRHIVAVNAAVKAAQETARNEKKLGSGLESDVHLFFDSSLFHESAIANKLFSTGNLEMLASAFVVSKVFIHIGKRPEKERLLDENLEVLAELKFCLEEGWHDSKKTTTDVVRIVKPSGEKCGRCWRYLEIKTEALCGRCEDVVKKDWPQLLES
jgi:isoleucyl-tRNA synthetase